ncbi:MAG: transcriptional regulator BetI [Alphaproteobacteria bacterium]|nr:MAG: transcriptional regulator BetI [Alphaproteobacteria bacterium]
MARAAVEQLRRAELIRAAIDEIGAAGSLDVTVGQIARRAGVSPALAHHYFGGKEQILVAAMRHILAEYGAEVRAALAAARDPRARLQAIITASFSPQNFRREVISAWLAFYLLARTRPEARRLLSIYHRRLSANLIHALRPLAGPRAVALAASTGALIDGVYLREVLSGGEPDGAAAVAMVVAHVEAALAAEDRA